MAKKILVVDDELDILKITAFILKKAGYEIITAGNGQVALDLIRDKKPDLILLDLRLPIINGYEVCKIIKNDEELKHIPIILFTARCVGMVDEKTKELEADDYMIKPFVKEELLKKVKKAIG